MEFNGAVLVQVERINKAIQTDLSYREYWNKNISPVLRKLIRGYEELPWWKTFGDCSWQDKVILFLNKTYNINAREGHWSTDYIEPLHQVGLINNTLYDTFIGVEQQLSLSNERLGGELSEMITCGEPVYLNPEQCRYVNYFYNLKEI